MPDDMKRTNGDESLRKGTCNQERSSPKVLESKQRITEGV